MKYISIGPVCNVRYQINKYTKPLKTLFFDWIGADMDSVIAVLNCNIDDILTLDNIIIDANDPIRDNHSKIIIKSLPRCVSVHDIKINFNDQDVYNFINKYKAKYKNMIEYIHLPEKICFIRYDKIETKQKELFIEAILRINSKCNFTLVSINISQPTYEINKDAYFLEINLTPAQEITGVVKDWTTTHLNWQHIFKIINEFA